MKVINLKAYKIYLGFVTPNGIAIDPNPSYAIIDDKYSGHSSLQQMITDGIVSIESYSVAPETNIVPFSTDTYSSVSAEEFNSFMRGLFKISAWTKTGAIVKGTGYSIRNTVTGPYNVSGILSVKFDDLVTVNVTMPIGIIDIDTCASLLNNHAIFGKYCVASKVTVEDVDYLKLLSKAVGPASKVEILADPGLALSSPVIVTPTGTVVTINITTINPTGIGVYGVQHKVQFKTTAGGATNSVIFKAQRVSNGVIEPSEMYKSEFTMLTGSNGAITFEVGTDLTITESESHLDVEIPAGCFLAVKPTPRLQFHGA